MTQRKLETEFLSQMVEENAWRELSEELQWTEGLLEKYQNKVDWDKVSASDNILWTSSMLETFRHRINWHELSKVECKSLFSMDNLERYQNCWDWRELSDNSGVSFSYELIEKYADRWDWSALISNYNINELLNEDFLNRFGDYIPAHSLQQSLLWDNIVEKRKTRIIRELTQAR